MNRFKELQDFGFNILTLVFIVTIFFSLLQAFALIKQNQKIVKNESGDSVSFIFFSFYGFAAFALIIYGLYAKSLAFTLNGFLGFILLSVSINVLKFTKVPKKEKWIGICSVIIIPMMLLIPQRDLLLLIFGLIIQMSLLSQVIKLWKSTNSGSVHPSQAMVSICSSTFWLTYSLLMNVWPMAINNTIGIVLWVTLLLVYFKKPKQIKTIS